MRFGSELLRKAEQIFTIIYQAPPQLMSLFHPLQGTWGGQR